MPQDVPNLLFEVSPYEEESANLDGASKCKKDADCSKGQKCNKKGECALPDDPPGFHLMGKACKKDSECTKGQVCLKNQC